MRRQWLKNIISEQKSNVLCIFVLNFFSYCFVQYSRQFLVQASKLVDGCPLEQGLKAIPKFYSVFFLDIKSLSQIADASPNFSFVRCELFIHESLNIDSVMCAKSKRTNRKCKPLCFGQCEAKQCYYCTHAKKSGRVRARSLFRVLRARIDWRGRNRKSSSKLFKI